jgi:3-oxoacyl-[acyl-carrier-protein] synthase-1
MVTAVGFNAPASLAAMRAGIRNVNQTNLWDMYSGKYLAAGKVPLPQWYVGLGKLADLAAPAILECLEAAKPVPAEEIPVLLGVAPPDRPFRFADLDAQIIPEIEYRLRFRLHPASHVIPRDHVSVVVGLREAGEIIANKKAPCVIVGAVDSLLHHELKNYYLEKWRLLTPINSNGFSLGEAGSAVLVTAVGASPNGELQVLGMSTDREKATIESDEPLRGEGLTQVIRGALREAGLTTQECQYRITDLNGEHYKFKEWALQTGRFVRKPTQKIFDLWHPIEYIGDVGAAIGPIVLAVALHAGQKAYGNGPTVLCTLGNDDGERAALVVSNGPEEIGHRPTETMIARASK